MRIGLVNAGKSMNVGDALLSYALEKTLKCIDDEIIVQHFDIMSGRYELSNRNKNAVACKLNKENNNPNYLFRFMKTYSVFIKKKKSLQSEFNRFIEDKDLIIFGGGHLLIDNYCAFLLNLSLYTSVCNKHHIRYGFFAVGVGSTFKYFSKSLLKKSMCSAEFMYTRDTVSHKNLLSHINGNASKFQKSGVVIDPAFFSSEMSSFHLNNSENKSPTKLVGFFIMDPNEISRHSSFSISRSAAADYWLKLIDKAVSSGAGVLISSNGAPTDVAFIKQFIIPKVSERNLNCIEQDFDVMSHEHLLQNIERCSFIVAQRLHAVIPAISFRKNFAAIKWDKKLENVLSDLTLSGHVFKFDNTLLQDVNFESRHVKISKENKESYFSHLKGILE